MKAINATKPVEFRMTHKQEHKHVIILFVQDIRCILLFHSFILLRWKAC